VHQAKYTKDIVRKFKTEDSKAMTTPMSTTTALDAGEEGEHVDQKEYRSMIGSLLYLMATDFQFLVCLCARFQASPRTSHRQAVKRIFRYLRHSPDFSLWYLLTDKRRIPLRSASVRTPHLFHHMIPKVLVNSRSKGITSIRSTFTL
jgi:hypothetical protein